MPQILEILARDNTFGVSTAQAGPFTTISGIDKWTWSESPKEVDSRSFDDGGHSAMLVVSRDIKVKLEGKKQVDLTTGARDTGQALIDTSVSGANFGQRRIRYYRIAMTNGNPAALAEIGNVIIAGSAKPSDLGGGNDDLMAWGADINVYGRPISASGVYSDLF